MIPDSIIEHAAHAILAADHPNASGWSGKPEAVRERYRRLARAALESADPTADIEHGFVGVTCQSGECWEGGYYPPGGWTPISDDGREFVYRDGDWLCPMHSDEATV
jgi:hypothetical protein